MRGISLSTYVGGGCARAFSPPFTCRQMSVPREVTSQRACACACACVCDTCPSTLSTRAGVRAHCTLHPAPPWHTQMLRG